MSMEMHWVDERRVVSDDEADGGVATKVVDVPLRIVAEGKVALVSEG